RVWSSVAASMIRSGPASTIHQPIRSAPKMNAVLREFRDPELSRSGTIRCPPIRVSPDAVLNSNTVHAELPSKWFRVKCPGSKLADAWKCSVVVLSRPAYDGKALLVGSTWENKAL